MLEAIREDPTMAHDVMGSADYLRVELYSAARSEMVTRLEDFMRRRSKIELVVHDDDIRNSPGLFDVAEILFGDDAERRLAEYFGGADAAPARRRPATPTPGRGHVIASIRKLLSGGRTEFDDAWLVLLEQQFEHWRLLTPDELERMKVLVADFFHRTRGRRPTGSP